MKGILVTSELCQPCSTLKKELAGVIASGEVEVVSLEENPDRAADIINKYGLGLPGFVIVSATGEAIATVV